MIYLLLDTEVFRAHQFDFARADFKRLSELSATKKVRVFTSVVIDGEVKRQMRAESAQAQHALRKTLKEHQVLRHSPKVPFDALVAKGAITELTETRLKQWEDWKNTCQVETLPLAGIDVDAIIDRYFKQKSPFGPGDKKSEFPDAVTLAAARKWSIDSGLDLFVVSRDQDVKAFCEEFPHLSHIERLSEFLERFTVPFIATAITETFYAIAGDFIDYIGDAFSGLDFVLQDVEGDVESVEVDNVTIDEVHVIDAQDGVGIAELKVTVDFTAHVTYEDPESGIWDGEDQRMLFVEHVSEGVESTQSVSMTVELVYDEDDPSEVEIQRVMIDGRTRFISLPNRDR